MVGNPVLPGSFAAVRRSRSDQFAPAISAIASLVSGRRRDAVYQEHDRLGVTGRIAEPVRAAACEAEAVAVLECPAFGIDGELHFALDHEACLLAVMRIEFVAGASAGLHMDQKQIEAAFRSGRTEQLLGDAGASQGTRVSLALQ